MNEPFNIETLKKAIATITYEPWESPELDKFMEHNKDIRKVMLATSDYRCRDIDFIPTKYGMLAVRYSAYVPPNTMYFIRQPYSMLDPFKPDWIDEEEHS